MHQNIYTLSKTYLHQKHLKTNSEKQRFSVIWMSCRIWTSSGKQDTQFTALSNSMFSSHFVVSSCILLSRKLWNLTAAGSNTCMETPFESFDPLRISLMEKRDIQIRCSHQACSFSSQCTTCI